MSLWQEQIITNTNRINQLIQNAKQIEDLAVMGTPNGAIWIAVSSGGVTSRLSLDTLSAYMNQGYVLVENEYPDIDGVNGLFANQSSQTVGRVQFVEDATFDTTVVSGYAYYEKLNQSTGSLNDYRKLSAFEVALIENFSTIREFTVKAVAEQTFLDSATGEVNVEHSSGSVINIVFDAVFSDYLEGVKSKLDSGAGMSLKVYNKTQKKVFIVPVNGITYTDATNTYYSVSVASGATTSDVANGDIIEVWFDLGGGVIATIDEGNGIGYYVSGTDRVNKVSIGEYAWDLTTYYDGSNVGASGDYSAVLGGANNLASGFASTVVSGWGNTVSGNYGFASGALNVVSNWYSAAIGTDLIAKSRFLTVVGSGNVDYTYTPAPIHDDGDPLFIVGNGTVVAGTPNYVSVRSDAFTVLRNGKVGINFDDFSDPAKHNASSANLQVNGSIMGAAYGSGNVSGTATYMLAVDADGNMIEEALPAVGTTDYVSNVVLSGNSLNFTGIGSAFGSSVDLSPLLLSYTFENGLTETAGDVKIGGTLTENIAIDLDGSYGFSLTNAGSAVALNVNANGIAAAMQVLHNGTGVGAVIQANNTVLSATSVSTVVSDPVASFVKQYTGTYNGALPILRLYASDAGGAGANFGAGINFHASTNTGSLVEIGSAAMVFEDSTNATYSSRFQIDTVYNGSLTYRSFEVFGDGNMRLPEYGSGNKTGTATYMLGVDVNGNLTEEAIVGGGSTDYVSNVVLSSNNLTFTGVGSAFNSSVDLSPLIAGLGNGDVSAATNFGTNNAIIRADGTTKGVQSSLATIDDNGNLVARDLTASRGGAGYVFLGTSGANLMSSSGGLVTLEGGSSGGSVFIQDGLGNSVLKVTASYTAINSNIAGASEARLQTSNLTATRTFQFPNASGTFALSSQVPSYTFQDGITESGGIVGLGGSLTQDVTISAAGNKLAVTGADAINPVVEIVNTSSAEALEVRGTTNALKVIATTGMGLDVSSASANQMITNQATSTGIPQTALIIGTEFASGAGAIGDGIILMFAAEDASGGTATAQSWIKSEWTNATAGALASKLTLQSQNGNIQYDSLVIQGAGSMQLPQYGAGNKTGTPEYLLAVDSSGNVIETLSGGGGSSSPTVTADTSSTIALSNTIGNYCNMASANSNTTYTTSGVVDGGWAVVLINAASEPTITGATKLTGALFEANTDMYMNVRSNSNSVEYYFSSKTGSFVINEEDMASDSTTKVPTQHSVKAFTENKVKPTITANTTTTIQLNNTLGNYCNMASANSATTYTTANAVDGGWAVIRINAASEPTITGASRLSGSLFEANTDMYLNVRYNGTEVEYYFSTKTGGFIIDEDDMASNSSTLVPTQQSVKAYVDANAGGSPTQTANTSTTISLANAMGNWCNMVSSNATTTYTTTGATLGGWARVLINASSEPTITGGTKVGGLTFSANTNMYLYVYYNGNQVEYRFESAAAAATNLYTEGDAADPNTETNTIGSNWNHVNGTNVLSSSVTDSYDGTYAIEFTSNNGADYSRVQYEFSGLTNGGNYTLYFHAKTENVAGNNYGSGNVVPYDTADLAYMAIESQTYTQYSHNISSLDGTSLQIRVYPTFGIASGEKLWIDNVILVEN